jgi:hypothetical protein
MIAEVCKHETRLATRNFDLTYGQSIELHIGLLGHALLFGELVLNLLLLRGRRLPDLFELLLKFSDPPLRHIGVVQQVDLDLRTIC